MFARAFGGKRWLLLLGRERERVCVWVRLLFRLVLWMDGWMDGWMGCMVMLAEMAERGDEMNGLGGFYLAVMDWRYVVE